RRRRTWEGMKTTTNDLRGARLATMQVQLLLSPPWAVTAITGEQGYMQRPSAISRVSWVADMNEVKPCSRCRTPTVLRCATCDNALCDLCQEENRQCVRCRPHAHVMALGFIHWAQSLAQQ